MFTSTNSHDAYLSAVHDFYLREAALDAPGLFYHVTISSDNGESFTRGIDFSRATGGGQGQGFYVWNSRDKAVAHAKHVQQGDVKKMDKTDTRQGEPLLVVFALPLSPEIFDVDTEYLDQRIRRWFAKYAQEIEALKGRTFGSDFETIVSFLKTAKGFNIALRSPDGTTNGMAFSSTYESTDDAQVGSAITNAKFLHFIQRANPALFDAFERENLPETAALKITPTTKQILPVRIERLDGTVVWKNPSPDLYPDPPSVS